MRDLVIGLLLLITACFFAFSARADELPKEQCVPVEQAQGVARMAFEEGADQAAKQVVKGIFEICKKENEVVLYIDGEAHHVLCFVGRKI